MTDLRDRTILMEQRQAIVSGIEDAALELLSNPDADSKGAPLVAACLQRAAEIARWVPYDPPAED